MKYGENNNITLYTKSPKYYSHKSNSQFVFTCLIITVYSLGSLFLYEKHKKVHFSL